MLVHTKQRIALAGMQTDLPNGLDDKTPPPLSKSFKNLKHFVKLLLAEMNLRGGDVRVAVQGLQDQNRMMGALAENDEVRACACVGFGVGWVVGGWGGGCASQTSQSNLHHSHTHTHTHIHTYTHTHTHTYTHTHMHTHTGEAPGGHLDPPGYTNRGTNAGKHIHCSHGRLRNLTNAAALADASERPVRIPDQHAPHGRQVCASLQVLYSLRGSCFTGSSQ